MPHMPNSHMNDEMKKCITACLECYAICTSTISHCLEMGGKHAEMKHIRVMQDCAQVCLTSADFMLRGSNSYARMCAICAEICDACAQNCEQIDMHDAEMLQCVEACHRSAETCRAMAMMMA